MRDDNYYVLNERYSTGEKIDNERIMKKKRLKIQIE